MAVESADLSGTPEDAGIFVEYVEGGENEEETYEEAWQLVNEKTLQGWKLRGMKKDPTGDGVELMWDAPGGRRRQQ